MSYQILNQCSKEQLQEIYDSSSTYTEILKKLNIYSPKAYTAYLHFIEKKLEIDTTKFLQNKRNYEKNIVIKREPLKDEDIFKKDSKFITGAKLLRKLIKRGLKEYKCEKCGISSWQGEELRLQLHHKDGNNTNNEIDNLQILCPNCHSQTENYTSKKLKKHNYCIDCHKEIRKNKTGRCIDCFKLFREKQKEEKNLLALKKEKVKKEKVKKEKVKKEKVKKENNIHPQKNSIFYKEREKDKNFKYTFGIKVKKYSFTKLSAEYGVSDKALVKWCKYYNLPYKKSEIKKYTEEEWEKLLL